jgi:hypothetical protein
LLAVVAVLSLVVALADIELQILFRLQAARQ